MATLTGTAPKDTYKDLLQVSNGNSGIDATLRFLSDGEGTNSTLKLSTTDILITSTATVTGLLTTTAGIVSGSDIISDTDSTDDLGSTGVRWANLWVDAITATDTLSIGGITTVGGDILSDTDSTDSLGSTTVRWLKGWFDTLTAGTLTIGAGSITDSSGAIDFGNENLVTTGTLGAGATTVTTLSLTSVASNWTNAGRTVADGGIFTTLDLNGGTIDGTVIGGATPATGTFTTFTSTGIDDNATSTQLTITDASSTFAGDVTVSGATLTGATASTGGLVQIKSSKNGTWTEGEILGTFGVYTADGSSSGAGLAGKMDVVASLTGSGSFNDMVFYSRDGSGLNEALRLDYLKNATFAGDVNTDGRFVGTGAVGTIDAASGVFTGRTTGGATVAGSGTSYDVSLSNKSSLNALRIPTGTQDVEIVGNLNAVAGGINLGATGSANLLDDYEEGTWTPVPADALTGGNTGTGTTRGFYTKVGNTVTVWGEIINVNTTGLTAGNVFYIQGLPFAASEDGYGVVRVNSMTIDGTGGFFAECDKATSVFRFRSNVTGSSNANLIVSDLTSGTADFFWTMTYRTDL